MLELLRLEHFAGRLNETFRAALKEGDSFPVTLSFEKSGEVTVNVDVLSLRAEGPDCADAGQ